jgi:hypothetical protein
MPKKSKKAKLIAEYRRKLLQLEGATIRQPIHTNPQPVSTTYSTYAIPKDISKKETPMGTIALPPHEFLGIKKDLIKTLIIIILFFSIELALWKLVG